MCPLGGGSLGDGHAAVLRGVDSEFIRKTGEALGSGLAPLDHGVRVQCMHMRGLAPQRFPMCGRMREQKGSERSTVLFVRYHHVDGAVAEVVQNPWGRWSS